MAAEGLTTTARTNASGVLFKVPRTADLKDPAPHPGNVFWGLKKGLTRSFVSRDGLRIAPDAHSKILHSVRSQRIGGSQ